MTVMGFKNFVFGLLLLFMAAGTARAQFLQADIGVNGLTCSQCSRSVEMQLRKLAFVQDVRMDLEHTKGTITFIKGKKVDVAALARAVKDAGFSLRFLEAKIDMQHIPVAGDGSFRIDNSVYVLLDDARVTGGIAVFRFTGKNFSGQQEKYKNNALPPARKGMAVYPVRVIKG